MTAPLLALTAYYNPFHGPRRRRNYGVFRRNLGVPLVTVEWSRDGRFDLSDTDADVMIRVEGGDVMWQKERLLNIGLARIRGEGLARDVAVVDADVVFREQDWARRVTAALAKFPMVHCTADVDYLPEVAAHVNDRAALAAVAPERSVPSLAHAMARGEPLFTDDPHKKWAMAVAGFPPASGNAGLAVALRLDQMPDFEFYDANIVGGGDLLLATVFLGHGDEFFTPRRYSAAHRADVAAWAARCLPPLPRPRIGWADNRALHLWHGTLEKRQYGERVHILGSRSYDPARDIDRSGKALRFTPAARELAAAVGAYLASRDDA